MADEKKPRRPSEAMIQEVEAELAARKARALRSVGSREKAPPVLREDALYGPHGDFCRAVEGLTEASTPAILAQLLVLYGCWCGPRAWVVRGEARHGPNVSAVIVGVSSHSLKGTAAHVAKTPYEYADALDKAATGAMPIPVGMQSSSGFASGEAVIDRLSDPLYSDPRCVVIETEYATMMKRIARDGSTLGPIMRQVFDQSRLETRSRGHGLKMVDPDQYWVGLAGHVTAGELVATLDKSSIYGGSVNRTLWFHAPRAETRLAFDAKIPEASVRAYVAALKLGPLAPPVLGQVEVSGAARDLWIEMNDQLLDDDPSAVLLSAMVGRNRVHVLRLAVNYMLSVGATEIGERELKAGRAVWDYCRQSAWHIFGRRTGDSEVDGLVGFLEDPDQRGMATTDELKEEFGPHYKRRVERAVAAGLVKKIRVKTTSGAGRPREHVELVEW